ncbi:MAG: hypothetical protein PHF86_09315 [Candidatus Nanoarchaeia archaeon]|nr:hypothetical protein [Candidatus Nanoarchaeia archaeon]
MLAYQKYLMEISKVQGMFLTTKDDLNIDYIKVIADSEFEKDISDKDAEEILQNVLNNQKEYKLLTKSIGNNVYPLYDEIIRKEIQKKYNIKNNIKNQVMRHLSDVFNASNWREEAEKAIYWFLKDNTGKYQYNSVYEPDNSKHSISDESQLANDMYDEIGTDF